MSNEGPRRTRVVPISDLGKKETKGTLLFFLNGCESGQITVLPRDPKEDYLGSARMLGLLNTATHVFFNPKGEMFAVRGKELFKGSIAKAKDTADWFTLAKCVSRTSWDDCKFVFFRSDGQLFAVTKSGYLFKGREPENVEMPWFYQTGTQISSGFEHFNAICFDPDDIMYGICNGQLRRNPPHSTADKRWLAQSYVVGGSGWEKASLFMGFSSDGQLWCVNGEERVIYTGDPPKEANYPWFEKATKIPILGDEKVKLIAFSEDKTIMEVLTLDFLIDAKTTLSEKPEIVTEQIYDNKDSTTILKSTFEVDHELTVENEFGKEHGMQVNDSVTAGITTEASVNLEIASATVSTNLSATHSKTKTSTVSFGKKNSSKVHFKVSSQFEVQPGKAVRQIAVVKKLNIAVPYEALVRTEFGLERRVFGTWKNCTFYDLKIRQVDHY